MSFAEWWLPCQWCWMGKKSHNSQMQPAIMCHGHWYRLASPVPSICWIRIAMSSTRSMTKVISSSDWWHWKKSRALWPTATASNRWWRRIPAAHMIPMPTFAKSWATCRKCWTKKWKTKWMPRKKLNRRNWTRPTPHRRGVPFCRRSSAIRANILCRIVQCRQLRSAVRPIQ